MMIVAIASCITEFLIRHKAIDNGQADVYKYGFEIIISSVFTCIISTVLGLVFKCLFASMLYLGMFIILRSICGGYHAKTYWQCNLIFAIVTTLVLTIFKFIPVEQFMELHYICIFLAIIISSVYAPIENENKPHSEKQKIYFRILSVIMVVLLALISCILIIKFRSSYSILIDVTLLVISISMFVTNPWRGCEKYEQDN